MDRLPALEGNSDKGDVDRCGDSCAGTNLYFALDARLASRSENVSLKRLHESNASKTHQGCRDSRIAY